MPSGQSVHSSLPVTCRYGFVVMDGNGSLFGTVSGNTREVSWACSSSAWTFCCDSLSAQTPRQGCAMAAPANACCRSSAAGAWQVFCRAAKEARPRRAVGAAVCAPADGEAAQLRAKGGRSCTSMDPQQRAAWLMEQCWLHQLRFMCKLCLVMLKN